MNDLQYSIMYCDFRWICKCKARQKWCTLETSEKSTKCKQGKCHIEKSWHRTGRTAEGTSVHRGFIHIFSRMATGFYRLEKHFELYFLWMLKPAGQLARYLALWVQLYYFVQKLLLSSIGMSLESRFACCKPWHSSQRQDSQNIVEFVTISIIQQWKTTFLGLRVCQIILYVCLS